MRKAARWLRLTPPLAQTGTLRLQDMPYRFTRNLHTFFSPFGVEGWFLTSMVLAAQAMLRRHSNLKWVLMLFFRDDLASHQQRMRGKARPEEVALMQQLLPKAVAATVEDTLARVRDISSTSSPAIADLAECKTARRLIETATDPAKLCMQDPTWCALPGPHARSRRSHALMPPLRAGTPGSRRAAPTYSATRVAVRTAWLHALRQLAPRCAAAQ